MPPPSVSEGVAQETSPALLEEILEDIFLRLPPAEPECLVRASLASKFWRALLSGPRFRSRYREHHGATPMLGFLTAVAWDVDEDELEEVEPAAPAPRFVSTTDTEFTARGDGWGHGVYNVWDCRHGRVLLGESNARKLAVWDPMTGRRWELQEPEVVYGHGRYAAAVLCAVIGCDHLACHNGPFRVVHLSLHGVADVDFAVRASCVSSADLHRGVVEWSDPCPGLSVGGDGYIEPRPPVLLNGALHFLLAHDDFDAIDDVLTAEILKYDLSSNSLSLIDAPNNGVKMATASVLMAMEDGDLGFAYLKKQTLFMWSTHVGSDGVAEWTPRRVIDLQNHLPIQNPGEDIRLRGSIEGSDVVFVTTDLGIYKINLKSLQHKKIWNAEPYLFSLIPYMSFYSPREKVQIL